MASAAFRIASRSSPLAVAQAKEIGARLQILAPDLKVEFLTFKTKGDKFLNASLAEVGGKGLFVREIEEALLDETADLAVHSLKDVPREQPERLELVAFPAAEDPRDVLIGEAFETLKRQARVGTASLRRRVQLLHHRPDLTIEPLRGNVGTRLEKQKTLNLDAIVLAAAGLQRLRLAVKGAHALATEIMIPAPGQGVLALEMRRDDHDCRALVNALNDAPTVLRVRAERAFLKTMQADCQVPLAGHAEIQGRMLFMRTMVASLDGQRYLYAESKGENPEALGEYLAQSLLDQGAGDLLKALRL